jgi:hypothetical protein
MITIQYLEDAPTLADLDPQAVTQKLRAAHARLPFSHLLIGWRLPAQLLDACRSEAENLGVRFIRWHPLLTGDGRFQPLPAWQAVGIYGQEIAGFKNLPQFTFVCPNNPAVQERIQQHLTDLLEEGVYQGFFLDRIRYPSPISTLFNDLGCFCEYCRQKAIGLDLDLELVRRTIVELNGQPAGRLAIVQAMLGETTILANHPMVESLRRFFDFRLKSITEFARTVISLLRASGAEIGLDCFSDCLTRMVGQDLTALGKLADWIKVMSYAHTLGPAGLPFELLGLVDSLITRTGLSETQALGRLSEAVSLPLPATLERLRNAGLSPQALELEVGRGVRKSACPILAGVELVEIKGITRLYETQIANDLMAIQRAGAAGLSISWDLWYIALDRLEQVRRVYLR